MTRRSPLLATRPNPRSDDVRPGRTSAGELARLAVQTPGRVAVVDAGDGSAHDYATLARDVRRLAGAMRAYGVGRGDIVSAQLPNWYELLVIVHATAHLGAILNPIVPIYREREVGFILRQAQPAMIFAAASFRGVDHVGLVRRSAPDCDATVVAVRARMGEPAGAITFEELLDLGVDLDAEPVGSVDDIALVLYTSGTTADPKGVLHSHATLGYEVRSFVELFALTADDAVFMPSPVTHITGLLFGALLPVVTGCAVTLLDVWDARMAADVIERDRCRFVMGATPFLLGLVEEHIRRGTPCALRVFACGGADVPPALVRRATDVLQAHVARVYGSSEFPTLSCGGPADDLDVRADTDGRPIGPVTCRIDDETSDPDGVGELLVAGPELFLGYVDPALNAAAFTPDGMFRTGDLAVIGPDGTVTIRGRRKDIIVRGGENISAREVEELLVEHPAVFDVAVVAMPDPVLVERVCAFVVTAAGAEPSVPELGAYLAARGLARQKHPERIEVIDELPLTASGKVQKFLLRERIRSLLDTATT